MQASKCNNASALSKHLLPAVRVLLSAAAGIKNNTGPPVLLGYATLMCQFPQV